MRSFLRSPLLVFLRLPLPLRVLIGVAAGGSAVGLLYWLIPPPWGMVVIGVLVVGALLAGLGALLKRRQKRKAAPVEQGIIDPSAATPQAIGEAGRRARIDGLRRAFEAGVHKLRAADRDLYSLPWYVIVGEPGSGKTEAIRHCNVGFPPGLHDPLQGAGGTANIDWWFTNEAVVLDTAGRLMFEQVEAGSTSEWEEFLRLLRSRRPKCPLNGLILAIPADTLVTDTPDAVKHKAGRIAQQLATVQRTLDVHFPVFVAVTKCDLIIGFREFFENIADPALRHQIVGWSNPDPLEGPFKPELVDQYIDSVCQRVRDRRLGLLLDPVNTEDPNAPRVDQVDALYTFPQSLARIASRLKLYLATMAAASQWRRKPLRLRGMYFTSSMRDGSPLDDDAAEALGVPVESLPDDRVWERGRSYFLRDFFLEKVFQEKGLVTRPTGARDQRRRIKAVALAAGFAAVLILGFFTWRGYLSRKSGVHYWLAAADDTEWDSEANKHVGYWYALVEKEPSGDTWTYSQREVEVAGKNVGIVEFHDRLRDEIRVPWIFWLAEMSSQGPDQRRRREAGRVLFEASVLRPVLDAVRQKIRSQGFEWSPEAADALAQLVRLELPDAPPAELDRLFELAVLQKPKAEAKNGGAEKEPVDYYKEYLRDHEQIHAAMKSIYGDGGPAWPRKSLGVGTDDAQEAVRAGVQRFCAHETGRVSGATDVLNQVAELTDLLLGEYRDSEKQLVQLRNDDDWKALGDGATEDELEEAVLEWAGRFAKLGQCRKGVEGKLTDPVSTDIVRTVRTFEARFNTIKEEFTDLREKCGLAPAKDGGAPPPASATTAAADPHGSEGEARPRQFAAELSGTLEEKLAEIGSIAAPKGLRGRVTDAADDFLKEVDIPLELWNALRKDGALVELLNARESEGDERKLRPYELRWAMYQVADNQLSLGDPVTFDDIDRVKKAIEPARDLVTQLSKITWRGGDLTREAHDVSLLVCQSLAGPLRLYKVLDALLKEVPTSPEKVADAVKARAAEMKAVPKPNIPFTGMQGEYFKPEYHPDAARDVLAECRKVREVLQQLNPKGGEPPAEWKAWKNHCERYVRNRYLPYWSQSVPNEPKLDASCIKEWKAFRQELEDASKDPLQGLQQYAAKAENALLVLLDPDFDKLLDLEETRKPLYDAVKQVRESLDLKKVKRVRGNWWKLREDPLEARGTLLDLGRDTIRKEYLAFESTNDLDFANNYWAGLTREALRLVLEGARRSAPDKVAKLQKDCSSFPLAKPGDDEDPVTVQDFSDARKLVELLLVRGTQGSETTKKDTQGSETRNSETERLLDELFSSLPLSESELGYVGKLKAVLDGLPEGDKTFTCVISLVEDSNSSEDIRADTAVLVSAWQGAATEKDASAKLLGKGGNLCDALYPGRELTLRVESPNSGTPLAECSVPGPWAVVRLLHPGPKINEDTRKWVVLEQDLASPQIRQIEIKRERPWPKGEDGGELSIKLKLTFKKGLPSYEGWPE